MGDIHVISASAGSGKTYRIAEALKEAVSRRTARPEAVVAMTFTNKAAAELHERVRQHLLSAGRTQDAQRLAAARIGTVNAVCGQLVGEFAFELGLSPDLRVLDETAATQALRRSLSHIVDASAEHELADLTYRMGSWDWQNDVDKVVSLARSNGVQPDHLAMFAERSISQISELLGETTPDANSLNRALEHALQEFLTAVGTNGDATKTTATAANAARDAFERLRHGRTLTWPEWARLATLNVGKASRDAVSTVHAAAIQHDVHPTLRHDLQRAVGLAFELARRGLEAYQSYKREHSVIDFVDQEAYCLALLRRTDVQRRLHDQIDLVLVDEFQDTSPIQLAVFLQLARIAPRSIWVGDQKQAIFGFRGTDPALMDAAIEEVVGEGEPESLPKSWRSRPALVQLTSELFAPAFADRGIPEARVRLEPADSTDDPGLGPVVECWKLDSKNKDQDASALADAVRQLLADESVRVREPATGLVQLVGPEDVAILCRTNATCGRVAGALASQDIPAVLPRAGLGRTPEGRVVLAGLQLWVDPDDTLAAAQLGRLIVYPDAGDEWLSVIIERGGDAAFVNVPVVQALREARSRHALSGALEALHRVLEVTRIQELCRRWGDAPLRRANVEAMQKHAVTFARRCAEDGIACTPAGLVRHLTALGGKQADEQGVPADQDAVTVSTWHRAKGLEWPVTVLFELEARSSDVPSLGVHVENDRDRVDLQDPLANRWIRFWPYPYDRMRKGVPYMDRVAAHPVTTRASARSESEELRLLYMGWTRARDRVVLAGREGKICSGTLDLLNSGGDGRIHEPDEEAVTWAGQNLQIKLRKGAVCESVAREPTPEAGHPPAVRRSYPPAFLQPSQMTAAGEVGEPEQIGDRIAVRGSADMNRLGSAVHGFLAADQPDLDPDTRRRIAERLLTNWSVEAAIDVSDVLTIADRFRAWANSKWPSAAWRREWPVTGRNEAGTVVRGQVDLVLEADEGHVIVDHKSFPGAVDHALERAAQYGGQLKAYADILERAGSMRTRAAYVHMPMLGIIVPISLEGSGASATA